MKIASILIVFILVTTTVISYESLAPLQTSPQQVAMNPYPTQGIDDQDSDDYLPSDSNGSLNNCEEEIYNCDSSFFSKMGGYDMNAVMDCYNATIQQCPNSSIAWYKRAKAVLKLNNYDEALISVNRAIELNGEISDYWQMKGEILTKLGKSEDAATAFSNASQKRDV